MFLPTNLTNRRGFLERSVLGAGSILLAPLLLNSCTDHVIPNPPTPNPPQVPAASPSDFLYWYDPAKSVIITGLSLQPQAGGFLGSLMNILWTTGALWPYTQSIVWKLAIDQMQDVVGQKIDDATFSNATKALDSLKDSINAYLAELNYGTPEQINDKWEAANDQFVDSQSFFTVPGYEVLLLPLFTQFATLYLALLRDGMAFGQSWGRSDGLHQQDIASLQGYIPGATQHVKGWYTNGHTTVVNNAGGHNYLADPFRTVNKYERVLTLLVLDFMTIWPYFDVTQYPSGANVVLTREIYSDPFGSGPIAPISSTPTQLPTQLSVWSAAQINSFQLTYPAGSGPGGDTQTPRMGDQGGNNTPPYGGTFTLSPDNPITKFRVVNQPDSANYQGPYVMAMQFQFNDGTPTNLLGGQALPSNYETRTHPDGTPYYEDTGWVGYGYEALSSVHINGTTTDFGYDTVVGLVMGFKYWQPPAATLSAIGGLYVTSPKEYSAAEFAKAFPKLGITESLITDDLKAARKAYWERMKK